MNIQITCDGFELTPSIKALIEQKVDSRLGKLLKRYPPEMQSALIRIQKDRFETFKVNFDMNLGKENIYAETTHKILESAVIDLSQEAERQIKKFKALMSNYSQG